MGTSEMMTLLRALARLTSQPLSANLMLSWLSSKISMDILGYITTFDYTNCLSYIQIAHIYKLPATSDKKSHHHRLAHKMPS